MARRPIMPKPQPKQYYIYDPGVGQELGGIRVKYLDNGVKVVMLLEKEQAPFYLRSGIIGTKPLSQLTPEERYRTHQLTGGRITAVEGKPVLTHQVKTMGFNDGRTWSKKIKVSTVRNVIQKESASADALKIGLNPINGKFAETELTPERRLELKKASMVTTKHTRQYSGHDGLSQAELRKMK